MTVVAILSVVLFGFSSVLVSGFIHGKYTENIRQYHLTVPHKATEEGDFSTFHLPHLHDYDTNQFRKKRKRELEDPDSVHYGIMIDNKLRHLELWPNRDFIHPQAVFENRDPTVPILKRKIRGVHSKKMCYYLGRVRGVENSSVALSTCDGLAGSITMGNKVYYIEPVERHSANKKGHHLHVVFQASKGKVTKRCSVDTSMENWSDAVRQQMTEEILNGKNIFKREDFEEISQPKWIELLVVCDNKYIMFHKGKRDIEQWVLTTLSKTKGVFAEGSMTAVIAPVIVRIIYLEKEEEEIDLNIEKDVHKTLESFCNWTLRFQPKDESHPNHFDIALLLSMWDFCDRADCSVTGVAYISQACSKNRNCGLAEENTWMTSLTIAHEMGHLLGMDHDNLTNPCPVSDPVDNTVYVMSSTASFDTLRWSPCSTATFRQMIGAHLMDCFNDEPEFEQYELGDDLIGVVYGAAEQCKMMDHNNRHYIGACPDEIEDLDERCQKLPCDLSEDDDACDTWHVHLADGSECDSDKWCINKKCVPKGTRPKAVDGGWGEWGDWTACTRSCGRGTQFQERICDNPRPLYPGKGCLGTSKKIRICNPQDCPPDVPPLRYQACAENMKKNTLGGGKLLAGLFDNGNPCNTLCKYERNKQHRIYSFGKSLPDGAKCEIGNPLKMCVSGRCIEVGCDNKLQGSEAIMDRCGICNGDGTRCKVVNGSAKAYPNKAPQMLTVVPVGATHVHIAKVEPSICFIALGLPDNKTLYFNNMARDHPGTNLLGAKKRSFFLYRQIRKNETEYFNTDEFIWDKTYEDVGVYNFNTVTWSWIEPSDVPVFEPKYKWEITEYKPCSRKCDSGIQEAKLACFEETAGRVSDTFCEKVEKPAGLEPKLCNEEPCKTQWKVGSWGRCRACKHKGGVRVREVQCIKMNPNPVGDDILTEDKDCKDVKPGTVELCESYKKCGSSRRRKSIYVPGKFQETIWQQMNKMHIEKRGAIKKPHAYLKGKEPPICTKSTTAFTWKPTSLEASRGQLSIDRVNKSDEEAAPIYRTEEKSVPFNETEGENHLDGPHLDTVLVAGTTKIIGGTTSETSTHHPNGTHRNDTHINKNSSTSTTVDAIEQCIMPSTTGPDTSNSTQEKNVTTI